MAVVWKYVCLHLLWSSKCVPSHFSQLPWKSVCWRNMGGLIRPSMLKNVWEGKYTLNQVANDHRNEKSLWQNRGGWRPVNDSKCSKKHLGPDHCIKVHMKKPLQVNHNSAHWWEGHPCSLTVPLTSWQVEEVFLQAGVETLKNHIITLKNHWVICGCITFFLVVPFGIVHRKRKPWQHNPVDLCCIGAVVQRTSQVSTRL